MNGHGGRLRYSAAAAQAQCVRHRRRPRDSVLVAPSALRSTVEVALNAKQSPGAIAADLRAEGGATVCAETIYQAVYGGVFEVKAKDCLRRRRARRRGRQVRHENRRAGLPNIGARPAIVNDCGEVGHFELDLIIGKGNQSGMLVALERATRYSALVTLPGGYRAEMVLAAMIELFEQVPAGVRRSVTFDQGSEWADRETLVATFEMAVWFCDPHSPQQRGAIEDHNGHVRYWYLRGSPLAGVDRIERRRTEALNNACDQVDVVLAAEAELERFTARARHWGATWAEIAAVLGVTRQSAHERYRRLRYDPASGTAWREPPLPL